MFRVVIQSTKKLSNFVINDVEVGGETDFLHNLFLSSSLK